VKPRSFSLKLLLLTKYGELRRGLG